MGIPLDSIIAESTKRRGIQVLPPDFERAKQALSNQKFDCILLSNVMQHLRYPKKILKGFTDLLDEKSCVIITIPNFKFVKYFYTALKYRKAYKNGEIFDKTRLHLTTHRMTTGWLSYSGLNVSNISIIQTKSLGHSYGPH
jgi:2-polyprenyl-3-methyl-5-hydroxy-6-metoxy-1,4-benzoquinol methylase